MVGTGETGLALSLEFVVGVSRTTLHFLFQHTHNRPSTTSPSVRVSMCVYTCICVCVCVVCVVNT